MLPRICSLASAFLVYLAVPLVSVWFFVRAHSNEGDPFDRDAIAQWTMISFLLYAAASVHAAAFRRNHVLKADNPRSILQFSLYGALFWDLPLAAWLYLTGIALKGHLRFYSNSLTILMFLSVSLAIIIVITGLIGALANPRLLDDSGAGPAREPASVLSALIEEPADLDFMRLLAMLTTYVIAPLAMLDAFVRMHIHEGSPFETGGVRTWLYVGGGTLFSAFTAMKALESPSRRSKSAPAAFLRGLIYWNVPFALCLRSVSVVLHQLPPFQRTPTIVGIFLFFTVAILTIGTTIAAAFIFPANASSIAADKSPQAGVPANR